MPRNPIALVFLPLACLFTWGCCHCRHASTTCPEQPPRKFAVLISTTEPDLLPEGDDRARDPGQRNNTEFWHDVVLTYCTLTRSGYRAEDIFVLYGDGTDFPSDLPDYRPPYCDGSAKIADIGLTNAEGEIAKDNLCNVVCCMATGRPAVLSGTTCRCATHDEHADCCFSCKANRIPRLRAEDSLFVWFRGHGEIGSEQTSGLFYADWALTGPEFSALLEKVPSRRRVFVMETCGSIGWLDYLNGSGDVVLVAAGGQDGGVGTTPGLADDHEKAYAKVYYENVQGASTTFGVFHGRFTYWIDAALQQLDLTGTAVGSDVDRNNLVSVAEAFNEAKSRLEEENGYPLAEVDYGGPQVPDSGDASGVAPCIFLRLPQPGKDSAVFSMDHPKDDATVPSDAPGWDDGTAWEVHEVTALGLGATPGKARIGERWYPLLDANKTYSISVRVYNIGCSDPGEVKVTFSLAPAGECDDPGKWVFLDQNNVNGLSRSLPQATATLNLDLSLLAVTSGSSYCLIAQLDATDDPANADGRVYWDKNKVQLTFKVQ